MHRDTQVAQNGKNVVIFANCQGWLVKDALKTYAPDFIDKSAIHFIENFTDDHRQCLDVLERCDLFLCQNEKGEEVERRFSEIAALLPPHATLIRFPMVGFNVFWPSMSRDYSPALDRVSQKAIFHFADRDIIRLWRKDLPTEQIIDTTFASEPASRDLLYRSLEMWTQSYVIQEQGCDVAISDLILKIIFERETFYWPTHCSNEVIFSLVDRILVKLGKRQLLPECSSASDTLHDWELPIHPAVANAFSLKYAPPDRAYLMPDGRRLTFREYLREYIDYLPRRYPELISGTK